MTTLLIKHASLVASMDDASQQWADGGIFVTDNVISSVGPSNSLPVEADQVIDARGMVIIPGLVNTHHHFFQTLTRAVPVAQNANLYQWLRALYPIWAGLTPEAIRLSTAVAIAELMLSGCTTSSDHTYIWPHGARLDVPGGIAKWPATRFHCGRRGGDPPRFAAPDRDLS